MDQGVGYWCVLIPCLINEPDACAIRLWGTHNAFESIGELLGSPPNPRFLLQPMPSMTFASLTDRLLLTTRHVAYFGIWDKQEMHAGAQKMPINARAPIALRLIGIHMSTPCRGNVVVLDYDNEDHKTRPLTKQAAEALCQRMKAAIEKTRQRPGPSVPKWKRMLMDPEMPPVLPVAPMDEGDAPDMFTMQCVEEIDSSTSDTEKEDDDNESFPRPSTPQPFFY